MSTSPNETQGRTCSLWPLGLLGILVSSLFIVRRFRSKDSVNNELSEPVATQSESAHEPELGLAARFEGVSREIHLSPNESERYYREQGKTYSLQKRTFWVGALTLIMLTLYTWYTAKMYSANKKSADAATKAAKAAEHAADIAAAQLELTERPWIVADIVGITSPLTFDKEGAHIVVEFTVKNTGNSQLWDCGLNRNFMHGPAKACLPKNWGRNWIEYAREVRKFRCLTRFLTKRSSQAHQLSIIIG